MHARKKLFLPGNVPVELDTYGMPRLYTPYITLYKIYDLSESNCNYFLKETA